MSGGCYDYAWLKVDDMVDLMSKNLVQTPERKAFIELLYRVSKAIHDVEYVDSGDFSEGDENDAILACFTVAPPAY